MLQNRFGDTEYPIRDDLASARFYRQARLQAKGGTGPRRSPPWVTLVVALAALLLVGTGFGRSAATSTATIWLGAAALAVLIVGVLIVTTIRDRRRSRLEQQHYWRLTDAVPVTPRQQQLLALDAQSDYGFGGWNSSLEYAPAWSRLPSDMQRRHQQEPTWRPFLTMRPLEADQLRIRLDADWRIASTADLQLFIVDALNSRNLTAGFTAMLDAEGSDHRVARLASLTGTDEWELRALTDSTDGRAAGLWAADTQRMISVVRMGYVAGYLDRDTAWDLIEQAAVPGTTRFTSWQAYWANVRIAIAYTSDRLDAVQQFDHHLDALRRSAWPAASTPFPAPSPRG